MQAMSARNSCTSCSAANFPLPALDPSPSLELGSFSFFLLLAHHLRSPSHLPPFQQNTSQSLVPVTPSHPHSFPNPPPPTLESNPFGHSIKGETSSLLLPSLLTRHSILGQHKETTGRPSTQQIPDLQVDTPTNGSRGHLTPHERITRVVQDDLTSQLPRIGQ